MGVRFLAFWGYKETSQLREILVVSIFLHHLVCWYFECTFSWNSSSFGKSWLSWCGAPPWRHQSVSFCAKTSNLSATTVPGLKNPWLITVPGIFFLSNCKLTLSICCKTYVVKYFQRYKFYILSICLQRKVDIKEDLQLMKYFSPS